MSEETGNTIKEIGKGIENVGCSITLIVLLGIFFWFAFKFC